MSNEKVLGPAPAEPFECHKLDTPSQVFFYEQDFYVLSNFSAFSLEWRGRRFATSEAAYHWEKFIANDPGVASLIRQAPSAHEAFKIAERYRSVRRADWDAVKVDIMRDILRAKVEQHEYVRRKLLATGDRELIEDSWRDDFWGWGPNRDGQNMLGQLWMEIRDELRFRADSPEESVMQVEPVAWRYRYNGCWYVTDNKQQASRGFEITPLYVSAKHASTSGGA
jgi:ribA/ribD-fused uncharacterized protein